MLVDDFQDFLLFFGLYFDGCQSLPDAAVGANGAHPFDSREGCGFMVGCAAKRAHSGNFGLVGGFHKSYLHTIVYCLDKAACVEIKELVAISTYVQVVAAGFAERSVFVHDVGEGFSVSDLAGSDAGNIKFELFLVVEVWEAFVTVECKFIAFRYLPYCNRNILTALGFNGKVGASLATSEKECPILEVGDTYNSCIGASVHHLCNIEVASVGNVVFLFHSKSPFNFAFYHHKTAEAVGGGVRFPLADSAVAEGCIAVKAVREKVSCGLELIADEAQAEEPSSHSVLGILVLLGLGACVSNCLCHL